MGGHFIHAAGNLFLVGFTKLRGIYIYAIEQNRFLMASGGGYFAQSLLCPTYRRLLKMN
jgi:hypothetical protein